MLATVVKVEQQISDGRQISFKDMNRSLCSWLRWHGDVKLDNSKVCRLSCNMQIFSLYLRVLNISLPFKTIIFSHFKYYFILFIKLISPITHEVTV